MGFGVFRDGRFGFEIREAISTVEGSFLCFLIGSFFFRDDSFIVRFNLIELIF